MLTREDVMEIGVLVHRCMSIRAIAREMHVSRSTVRCYLRDEEASQIKERSRQSHKFDCCGEQP